MLVLGVAARGAGYALLALLVVAASLEAFFAICLGCHIFALLIRLGVIPEEVRVRCADLRFARSSAAPIGQD